MIDPKLLKNAFERKINVIYVINLFFLYIV